MSEPVKLSLERPYKGEYFSRLQSAGLIGVSKDDKGEYILNVVDITQDGDHILEPRETITQKLGDKFSRIFTERGVDFFEKLKSHGLSDEDEPTADDSNKENDSSKPNEAEKKQLLEHPMTLEELNQMRKEMFPQLHVALGEMSQARDLLSLLLSTSEQTAPVPGLPGGCLTSAIVSRPAEIPSVQAFHAQLLLGGKDEALRKSAAAFKTAADSMERVRHRGEKYWSDALRTRNDNWGLVPAPLPPGAPIGKGADKTARDFWITFGLAESPMLFKRRAMAHLAVHDSEDTPLVFPRHQATRMRVSLVTTNEDGKQYTSHDTWDRSLDYPDLNSLLRSARDEIIDQEIFAQLIREAAMLPTATVSVSERLLVIEVSQNSELRFELVESDLPAESPFATASAPKDNAICDLIHSSLILLLLRAHSFTRTQRLSLPSSYPTNKQRPSPIPPPLLVPVFNMLQYRMFCNRVETELNNMDQAMLRAGVPSKVRFNPVGETGMQLVDQLRGEDRSRIGGDAILRVNNRHTLHFTFLTPSNLIANLPQATLTITSVPQLCQLVRDEVERCLLDSICKIGKACSTSVDGTWFVDNISNRCVGRWETRVLTVKVYFASGAIPDLTCNIFEVKGDQKTPIIWKYGPEDSTPFLRWFGETVSRACTDP